MDRSRNFALFLGAILFIGLIHQSTEQIPQQVWQMMKDKNITSTGDFIKNFLKKKNPNANLPPGHGPRPPIDQDVNMEDILFHEEGTLKPDGGDLVASIVDVERDKCEIKKVSYKIPPLEHDPNVIFWPSCVKLDQCSGCCNNEMLECSPIFEQSVEYEVLRARYPFVGADYFEFEGVQTMVFKRHIECECRCRVQPKDCLYGLHVYEEHSCRCVCHNWEDALSCVAPKVWSNPHCACKCPYEGRACYDDEIYSEDSCSCVRDSNIDQGPPSDFINNGDLFCEQTMFCRAGYRPFMTVDGACQCAMDTHSNMEGSLVGGPSTGREPRPRPPAGGLDIEKVPDHPMFSVHETAVPTRAPRPPRRTRRPRG